MWHQGTHGVHTVPSQQKYRGKYKHIPEKQTYALKQQRVGQGLGGARVVERMWKMIKHPGTDLVSLSKSLLLDPAIGEVGAET